MGTNRYEFCNTFGKLFINSYRYGELCVLFDLEDFDKIKTHIWRLLPDKAFNTFYAISGNRKTQVLFHRLILNCQQPFVVDHINHNGLDNRKCNLNICTQLVNMQNQRLRKTNKTGYKNISYDNERKKWVVKICHNKLTYKKRFCYLEEAIMYRNNLFNLFDRK